MGKPIIHKCDNCGKDCGTSEEWSDEERDAEAKENWGEKWFKEKPEDRGVICDECYQNFMRNFN